MKVHNPNQSAAVVPSDSIPQGRQPHGSEQMACDVNCGGCICHSISIYLQYLGRIVKQQLVAVNLRLNLCAVAELVAREVDVSRLDLVAALSTRLHSAVNCR